MQYVVSIMATAQTSVDVVVSKQLNRAGVITASTAHTQPVSFWDAQSVSKPDDY
jgi:hypothetical protein